MRVIDISSNVNEVIRAVLNFFFTKIFHMHKKVQNAFKKTKIKKAAFYALEKYLGKKICLFAFLCFLYLCLVVSLCFLCFCLVASLYFLCFLCFLCSLCVWNLFIKKIKRFETAIMTSFTLLLIYAQISVLLLYKLF